MLQNQRLIHCKNWLEKRHALNKQVECHWFFKQRLQTFQLGSKTICKHFASVCMKCDKLTVQQSCQSFLECIHYLIFYHLQIVYCLQDRLTYQTRSQNTTRSQMQINFFTRRIKRHIEGRENPTSIQTANFLVPTNGPPYKLERLCTHYLIFCMHSVTCKWSIAYKLLLTK